MYKKIKLVIIIVSIAVIAIILVNQNLTQTKTSDENQYITKGSITNSTSYNLSENYTSAQLLNFCTSDKNQIYNDVCVRGLWDVSDQCKNENFSNTNMICKDQRFIEFENKVDKVMQDLDKSLTQFVDSCINTKSDNDVNSCTTNIERIKNDCTDPRFYGMMSICKDVRINLFNGT